VKSSDTTARLRPQRLEGPITDSWRVFPAADERFALALAKSDTRNPTLDVALAPVTGHPFDLAPKRFDRERVRELRDALTEWLETST
jgi:hypothetical protein